MPNNPTTHAEPASQQSEAHKKNMNIEQTSGPETAMRSSKKRNRSMLSSASSNNDQTPDTQRQNLNNNDSVTINIPADPTQLTPTPLRDTTAVK